MTWDEHAKDWDDNEAVRTYAKAAFESLTALCDKRGFRLKEARVCDFGCGTGLLTEKLSPLCQEIAAVDTSSKMIEVLDKKIDQLSLSNVRTSTEAIDNLVERGGEMFSQPFDLVLTRV